MSCLRLYAAGGLGRRAVYQRRLARPRVGLLLRLFFFIGAIKKTNTPTVMRRHREDIFHTTCTAYTTPDPRDPSIPLRSTRDDSFRCHVERRGLGPEVETSRHNGTFTIATRTGSRPSDRRDSSTAPALGMTITSVTLSGAIAESKGLEFAEHSPLRFARALAISPSRPLDSAALHSG